MNIKCPVCHMQVPADHMSLEYQQMHFAFCSAQCRERFEATPHLYIGVPGEKLVKQAGREVIKNSSYLKPLLPSIMPLFLLSSMTSGAGDMGSACPQEQLVRVHAHWHSLIMERDPGARAQLIREHRELVDSLGGVAETGVSEVGAGCPQSATMQRHELENLVEMHSMMLDMVE